MKRTFLFHKPVKQIPSSLAGMCCNILYFFEYKECYKWSYPSYSLRIDIYWVSILPSRLHYTLLLATFKHPNNCIWYFPWPNFSSVTWCDLVSLKHTQRLYNQHYKSMSEEWEYYYGTVFKFSFDVSLKHQSKELVYHLVHTPFLKF